jgi:hypothetical protein
MYEGRYIAVAYERAAKADVELDYKAPVTLAIGKIFDGTRARYIDNRAGATTDFKLKLAGKWAGGAEHKWENHAIEIDGSKVENVVDRVMFVDWLIAQPKALPKSNMVATGTFTLQGVTRPIAVRLDADLDRNRQYLDTTYGAAAELSTWMSVNRNQ